MRNVTIEDNKIIIYDEKVLVKKIKIPKHCDRKLLQRAARFFSKPENNGVDVAPLSKYCSEKVVKGTNDADIINSSLTIFGIGSFLSLNALLLFPIYTALKVSAGSFLFLCAVFEGKSYLDNQTQINLVTKKEKEALEELMGENKKDEVELSYKDLFLSFFTNRRIDNGDVATSPKPKMA